MGHIGPKPSCPVMEDTSGIRAPSRTPLHHSTELRETVCVRVCVSERERKREDRDFLHSDSETERERGREGGRERGRERERVFLVTGG